MADPVSAAAILSAMISTGHVVKDIFNADRKVSFKIVNNTNKPLTLVGTHMDCGKQNAPAYIAAKGEGEGTVASKHGMFGVKGALIYKWGDEGNGKEKIAIFIENPVRGGNRHGIQYYWDSKESLHWYYCNIDGSKASGDEIRKSINGWFHISSTVTGGNEATAAFVVRTDE